MGAFLACSGHLCGAGWEHQQSLCLSVSNCGSQAVQGWVSLTAGSAAGLSLGGRLGNTSISVMDVVSYQKHSCVSCGLWALAFHLF